MPAFAPFNAALARTRELIAKLEVSAGGARDQEAAERRARELDADEFGRRHPPDHAHQESSPDEPEA